MIIKVYAFGAGVARDNDLSWLRSLLSLDTYTDARAAGRILKFCCAVDVLHRHIVLHRHTLLWQVNLHTCSYLRSLRLRYSLRRMLLLWRLSTLEVRFDSDIRFDIRLFFCITEYSLFVYFVSEYSEYFQD